MKVFLSLNLLFQSAAILQKFLRGFLIVPEVRRGSLLPRFDSVLPALPGHQRNLPESGQLALSEIIKSWFSIPELIELSLILVVLKLLLPL